VAEFVEILNDFHLYFHPYSLLKIQSKSLNYYCSEKNCKDRYTKFQIKKKSGGLREINAPLQGLKDIQRVISELLQFLIPVHEAAYGFAKKKNVALSAQLHLGKQFVYNIDIKDFFHSFSRSSVKLVLLDKDSGIFTSEKLAFLVAGICTYNIKPEAQIDQHVLPQGAPTSPVLTNILCLRLDRKLVGLANRFHATYSRYADDITFSSDQNVFVIPAFQRELRRLISEIHKLELQETKSRIQHKSFRQEVTGVIVNEKLNVPKRFLKNLKMYLYLIEKYGEAFATQCFQKDFAKDRPNVSKEVIDLKAILGGKLNYLSMIRGKDDNVVIQLTERYKRIFEIQSKHKKPKPTQLDQILNILLNKGLEEAMKAYLTK
jgi:retron-type reverse transcriptase